jgi:hypothetical protein
MRLPFVTLLALAHAAVSSPLAAQWSDMSVKHAWEVVPSGWISQGAAPAEQKMVSLPVPSRVLSRALDELRRSASVSSKRNSTTSSRPSTRSPIPPTLATAR